MRLSILLLSFAIVFLGCTNDDSEAREVAIEPKCLQTIIDNALQFNPTTPRANIQKFFYGNEDVFQINVMNFPDGQSSFVNLNCEVLCIGGGLTGENDCENFESAEFIETIWTDTR